MMSRDSGKGVYAKSDQGFTLVEALVALTLLSLVLTALFSGYRFGAAAWQKQQARAEDTSGAARRYLGQLFERVYPLVSASGAAGNTEILFDGTQQSATFAALSPPYPAGVGLHRFRLRIERVDGRDRLLIAFADQPQGSVQWLGARETVLMETDGRLSLDYLGQDDAGRWSSRWRARDRLPAMVRLTVGSGDEITEAWVFALRASATSACMDSLGQKPCQKDVGV